MKGTYLGEFQEIVLLTILLLDDNAYGVSIQEEINDRLDRNISRGSLHTALSRLEDKGFVTSQMGEGSAVRGGRRKRFYTVTNRGKEALQEAKKHRDDLYQAIPKVSWDRSKWAF